jgi:hypothetical protein
VDEGRVDALHRKESARWPEHGLGVFFIVFPDLGTTHERSGPVPYRQDAVNHGVLVLRTRPLVVCCDVRQLALGVDAAVGSDQNLHGPIPWPIDCQRFASDTAERFMGQVILTLVGVRASRRPRQSRLRPSREPRSAASLSALRWQATQFSKSWMPSS